MTTANCEVDCVKPVPAPAPIAAETASANSTANSATLTYFSDASCSTVGGGPPGLLANPLTLPVGQCVPLLSSGYAVKGVSCSKGGTAVSDQYPMGCNSPATSTQNVAEGKCSESQGVHYTVVC
jgi:hypothetical protein